MDAYLAIASRRETRDYAERPLPDVALERILQAGRIAGSGRNRQPWRFVVVSSRERLDALAETVSRADNVRRAPLAVAIAVRGPGMTAFDGGRAAQNMLLAAWNEGIGGCPNGFVDKGRAAELLELAPDQEPLVLLTFGYPARPRDPASRTSEEWLACARRLPLEELVQARL
jgi:nitroreductase